MASPLPSYEEVHALHAEWLNSGKQSVGRFARETGRSASTVKRWLHQYRATAPAVQDTPSHGDVILAIGDLHAPFMHPDAIAFLQAAKDKFAPTRIVLLGDELDGHALSQYDPDPDGFSAGHELNAGLEQLQPLYKLFPVASVCVSNHGIRPFKRAYQAGIPKAFLKSYREFMACPQTWFWEERIEIGDWLFEHGEGVSGPLGAMKKAMNNMKSTAIGHLHSDAGVLTFNNGDRVIYALNAGCMIDAKAYAFAYGKHSARKPVIGVAIIERGIPHFHPMQMDASQRWTGAL